MANFKSKPFKMVSCGRYVIKFDVEGKYSTSNKDYIKTLGSALDVKEVKAKKDAS